MSFTGYAQARGFDPIQVPSETILKNILQQEKFVGENMKQNHKLQREFANTWFNALQKNNSIQISQVRSGNRLAAADRARMTEEHLDGLRRNIEDWKQRNPQSKAAVVDKLGSLAKLVPELVKPITEWKQQQNKEEYKEGLFIIDQLGASPEQIGNLRALERDLFDSNRGYVAAAQEILPQATEKDILQIRNSTGWTHYGMIQASLSNSVGLYHQEILNQSDVEYPIGDSEDMSLNQATASGNTAAANIILSQIQRDFAAQQFSSLNIETPDQAVASEYFDKLKKVTNARYSDVVRESEKQAYDVNRQTRQIETNNALNRGGIQNWYDEVIETYRDDDNKHWRKNAIHNQFPYVLDYLRQTDVPISEAEDMLSATREDGKTPLLGAINRDKVRAVIAKKIGVQDQVREKMVSDRKLMIDIAKVKIEEGIRTQGLNNQGIQQLWQEYKAIPELREYISSFITDSVPASQDKLEAARLALLDVNGELTTQAVLQSKTNPETKLKFLAKKGIDKPYPEQSKNLKSDLQSMILQKMAVQSYEQLGAKEASVRMATDDISSKAMRRFVSLMKEGNVSVDDAYQVALGYGKSFVEDLDAKPFKLDDPNSGYIEGYTVDANQKPISTDSRRERRALMKTDTNFYQNTPLDTKQDYEYLRQKLLSGGGYDSIVNDKFSWVRDVVAMYNGRLTKEEILTANAKTLGVELVFPEAIMMPNSNISPGALMQWRINARDLNSKLGSLSQAMIHQHEAKGWRSAETMAKYTQQARAFAQALRVQESGNPSAINKDSGAAGMYQIMPGNIAGTTGTWDLEAVGRHVTMEEYMGDPVLQEKIALFHINKALQHQFAAGYKGDLAVRRAASIWYSGHAGLYDDTRDQSQGGTRYPTIQEYTLRILERYKAIAGGQQ